MYLRRAGLLTLQAGLLVYGGARAARAFMDQAPPSGDARAFAGLTILIPTEATPPAPEKESVPEGLVAPWQASSRPIDHSTSEELVDPWPASRAPIADTELLDPWRNDQQVASLSATAAFDWDTSPPELLNPWPAKLNPVSYDFNDLIDPWSSRN